MFEWIRFRKENSNVEDHTKVKPQQQLNLFYWEKMIQSQQLTQQLGTKHYQSLTHLKIEVAERVCRVKLL